MLTLVESLKLRAEVESGISMAVAGETGAIISGMLDVAQKFTVEIDRLYALLARLDASIEEGV